MRSEDHISTELLIAEVKKYPTLYNSDLTDYNDRLGKMKAWEELSGNVFPNWKKMPIAQREKHVNEVRKRWRSLRDAFIKAYRKESKNSKKRGTQRGKRYVHFEKMKFIIPYIKRHQKACNVLINRPLEMEIVPEVEIFPTSHSITKEEFIEDEVNATCTISVSDAEVTDVEHSQHPQSDIQKTDHFSITSVIHTPEEDVADGSDSDRLFLLSLMPFFQKMDERSKCSARIEVMQVISKYFNVR